MKRYLLLIILGLMVPRIAFAAHLSPRVASTLNTAIQLQSSEPEKAISMLTSAKVTSDFEKVMLNRVLGVLYLQTGEKNRAISALSFAADSGELAPADWQKVQRTLADILLSEKQYKAALARYYSLVEPAVGDTEPQKVWLRIAQAHYQLSEWQKVLDSLMNAMNPQAVTTDALTLRLGAEVQLQRWESSVKTLQQLIMLEPSHSAWWRHLAATYQRVRDDENALNTLVLMMRRGIVPPK
ncbi:hypothetical protein CS022_11760 [Veronia nyctiphanis]|uniref:Uncharacterized protein n=1 Tax=Veronia nyctiphanis TaxID=1278244 RepID=A0A4Q0YQ11_9GAMM|nr:hypothetical protein [Veronia nyctiphanis]RXJ73167.1 hypothetical protein CS022_11760 [Veronia nyctiphanis]